MRNKITVGIALDSGGAMGGAHIGVLEVLREHDIPIDIIIGSSAGAAVGAMYACGALDAFKELISDISFLDALSFYADPVFPVSGLFAGEKARKFLHSLLGDTLIEDLPITFVAVATDLLTGETVPLSRGSLVDAVMASISMPGIFKPAVVHGRLLADGGVSDPLPLDILAGLNPDVTIACNLHSKLPNKIPAKQKQAIVNAQEESSRDDEDLPSWFIDRAIRTLRSEWLSARMKSIREKLMNTGRAQVEAVRDNELFVALQEQLVQSRDRISSLIGRGFAEKDQTGMLNIFEVMLSATNIQQYQKNRLMLMHLRPDILIEPVVEGVRALEFNKGEHTIEQGRSKALQAVPEIKALLERKSNATEQRRGRTGPVPSQAPGSGDGAS